MSKNRNVKRTSRNAKKPAKKPNRARPSPPESHRSREIVGIFALGAAIFVVAALLSIQIGDGSLMGPLGRTIASVVYGFTGLCSYLLAAIIIIVAVRLLGDRSPLIRIREALGLGLGLTALAALIHLTAGEYRVMDHGPGGVVGEHIAEVFRAVISTAGTALLCVTALIIASVIATPLRMRRLGSYLFLWGRALRAVSVRVINAMGRFCGEVIRAILPERDRDEYLDGDYDEYDDDEYDAFAHEKTDPGVLDPPIIEQSGAITSPLMSPMAGVPVDDLSADTEKVADALDAAIDQVEDEAAEQVTGELDNEAAPEAEKSTSRKKKASQNQKKTKKATTKTPRKKPRAVIVSDDAGDVDETDASRDGPILELVTEPVAAVVSVASQPTAVVDTGERAGSKTGKSATASSASDPDDGPVIVESEFKPADAQEMEEREKQVDAERLEFLPLDGGDYQLPPIHLLDYDETQRDLVDRSAMLELSARLTRTLQDYGVKGEVAAIRPGPVVTMYEFAPAPGIRINKIVNLSDDLAMVLEALSVRIVAPIPGKAAVGIEVPNKSRESVYLKEILADDTFRKGKHKLPLALGKTIEGAPQVVDLAKMPHLLVAGTTGSGKSVSINTMITSLLYSATPEDVRMIMVDPKMLELSIYEGIPHLLLPVVTDPKKANLALRWGVEEMERRYDLLARMGVRDLGGYNKKAAKARAQKEAERLRRAAEEAERIANGEEVVEITEERQPVIDAGPEHLPYIVIIIDEFADLMMCAPKEVETSVARIAQKARAAGIHLILATQRPSVDVITGLIKANFPSRAAFRVASKVDSRTILDQMGAETLLGAGDMLFSDRGTSPQRCHGCFVDEDEIERVVDFLKTQGRPVYDMDILRPRDEEGDPGDGGASNDEPMDEMYDRAVAVVSETQQVSISMIQRRLRIGYNRAARIVEHMEREGVVSPPDHTNKREVLIQPAA